MKTCGARIVSANGKTTGSCDRRASHDGYHHFAAKGGAYRFMATGSGRTCADCATPIVWDEEQQRYRHTSKSSASLRCWRRVA